MISLPLVCLVIAASEPTPTVGPADPASALVAVPSRGPRAEREEAAFQLARADRHGEAAREFEVLWDDFGEPRYLYKAAMSRLALGHGAHAARYLDRYLASHALAADERADVLGQLAETREGLRPVRIVVRGETRGLDVRVEHVPALASDLRPPLPVQLKGGEAELELDPGGWRVVVRRGEVVLANPFRLAASEAPLEVLIDAPPLPLQEVAPRPLVIGLSVAGSGVAAVGLGLTIGGAYRAERLLHGAACTEEPAICGQRLFRALNTRTWGIALAGAGGGAAAAGLSALIRDRRSRRLAWIAEIAAGASLATLGVVGLAVADRLSDAAPPLPSTMEEWPAWARTYDELGASNGASLHAAGGFMLGVGSGLAGGALVGLLGQRRRHGSKERARAQVIPAGLGLVGAF